MAEPTQDRRRCSSSCLTRGRSLGKPSLGQTRGISSDTECSYQPMGRGSQSARTKTPMLEKRRGKRVSSSTTLERRSGASLGVSSTANPRRTGLRPSICRLTDSASQLAPSMTTVQRPTRDMYACSSGTVPRGLSLAMTWMEMHKKTISDTLSVFRPMDRASPAAHPDTMALPATNLAKLKSSNGMAHRGRSLAALLLERTWRIKPAEPEVSLSQLMVRVSQSALVRTVEMA